MRVQLERRSGTDRRQISQFAAVIPGPGRRWYEASFGPPSEGGMESYDPRDPYWEPMRDQDED